MKKFLTLAVAALIACGGFVVADEEKKSEPVNKVCPLSNQKVDPKATTEVKVEFCCDNCKGKFEKEPGEYLEKIAKAEDGKCILTGLPAPKSSKLVVAFCCPLCKGKFEKDPKEYITKVKVVKED